VKRDRAVLAALYSLFEHRQYVEILGVRYTRASLAARIEQHIKKLARVAALTIKRRVAIREEREDEADLIKVLAGLKDIAGAQVGRTNVGMLKLGFVPDKVPYVSTETKLAANVKRQATRKERGIVSRKKKR
jgi:hypothetical protein